MDWNIPFSQVFHSPPTNFPNRVHRSKTKFNGQRGFKCSLILLIFTQFYFFLFCWMHFLPIFSIIFLGIIQFANGDVLCTGLPNGGRLYCPVACCISQEGNRQTYHCCGSMSDNGPGWVYREKSTSAEGRPSRYVSYSTVRIDWWNSLLISLAVSIILSIILSLLCCFFCSRRRR